MRGYRTRRIIVAALLFIAPALAHWGFDIDAEAIAAALVVIVPAAMAAMRAVTRSPLGRKQPKRNLS